MLDKDLSVFQDRLNSHSIFWHLGISGTLSKIAPAPDGQARRWRHLAGAVRLSALARATTPKKSAGLAGFVIRGA
jgi:hypothetical protein